jgi:hypothetical protein
MLIHLHAMRELRSNMKDSIEAVFRKGALYQCGIAEIALDAGKSRKSIFILLEVNIDDSVAFAQKAALENSTEEAGGSSDEIVGHMGDCTLQIFAAGVPSGFWHTWAISSTIQKTVNGMRRMEAGAQSSTGKNGKGLLTFTGLSVSK